MNPFASPYILLAVDRLGPLSPSQLTRFLFESGLTGAFDLLQELTSLREEGLLVQSASQRGILYGLTDEGRSRLEDCRASLGAEPLAAFAKESEVFAARFEREKNYIAQHTEGATGICPVFLSIKQGPHIILQITIDVNDVDTAKIIARHWMDNAHDTYDAVWDHIAPGLPKPVIE